MIYKNIKRFLSIVNLLLDHPTLAYH
eukprot:SAG11_NODE_5728_length_1477_cov_4.121916_1_plen_25_part_01